MRDLKNTWRAMHKRCYKEYCSEYSNYGGRGIEVCSEWHAYDSFFQYVSTLDGFEDSDRSLDRIDVNGNYEPGNVRWATIREQNRNKQNTIMLNFNGQNKSLSEWAEELKIPYNTLISRIRLGWSNEDALNIPVAQRHLQYDILGETIDVSQGSVKYGIAKATIHSRLKEGWPPIDAFTKTVRPMENVITFNGESKNLKQWADDLDISYSTLKWRYQNGWLPPKLFKKKEI